MALLFAVGVGLVGLSESSGTGLGLLFIYTLFGLPAGAAIGAVAGLIIGAVLGSTGREHQAPQIAAVAPAVLFGFVGVFVLLSGETALALLWPLAGLLFAPFGYLAGRAFAKKMA